MTDHDEYYADDTDDIPLSSNTKGFLKTATTLISHLFCEDDSNEAENQDESEAIELGCDPNNNQINEYLFERLQAHIKQYSTHSTPALSMTIDDRSRVSGLKR